MTRKLLIAAVLAAVTAGGLYAAGLMPKLPLPHPAAVSKSAKAPPVTAAPAVTVSRATTMDFNETVAVTGSLVARDEIMVAPEVEGLRVLELLVEEGDRVKKGQALARLVSDTLEAQVAQSDANLARAAATIAQARSNITQAEARLVEARNAFERAKPLRNSGVMAESAYDTRESAARTAEAQLVAAKDGLTASEAERRQIEAQRRELDWKRARTDVRAPADGLVSRRNARVGAIATAVGGEAMFRIIARGEIELDAEVPEAQLAKIKEGQAARVTVAGVEDAAGKVRLVSPEIDKTTRLGRARIFLGDNPLLRIGAFGRGVVASERARGIGVPVSAVVYHGDMTTVQVVNNTIVETHKVKTGLTAEGMVEIRDGVREGDLVVARAGTFLRDGDTVRPVLPEPNRISEVN